MKIAVITGASSGLGVELLRAAADLTIFYLEGGFS